MASPLTQQFIAAITAFLTTGDSGPITASAQESADIAGQKVVVSETVTVSVKKA